MKIGLYTLGCKVNQFETQAMESALRGAGHTIVPFDGPADAYLINTCTVTAVSDKKSRAVIRRARRRSPGAVIAVCGCFAQISPDAVAALGADLIGGSGDRMAFIARLETALRRRMEEPPPTGEASCAPPDRIDDALRRRAFEPLPSGGPEHRTRALLKIEDGCAGFCSYCIIPYARGPVRSLPLRAVAGEAARLKEQGYREIVLTGIEISSYGRDLAEKPSLLDAAEAVCAAAGPEMRVRLGSLEPRTVTEEFCRRLAALPGVCDHFHLSLQSGCDDTLRRMNRKYDTARFLESLSLLRRFYPDPGVTADLIVGFPGETEEEFSQTLAFIARCGFRSMHIFPYSRRRGTPAAALPAQVPRPEREARARRAAARAAEMEAAYLARCAGKVLPVLFETEKDGVSYGYAPNYARVAAAGTGLNNRVLPVLISNTEGRTLYGSLYEEAL